MSFNRRQLLRFLALAASPAVLRAQKPVHGMLVRCTRPENLEMPLDAFSSWITPNDKFFVRSHHYTPRVTLADYRLQVAGLIRQNLSLRMEDLRGLPRHELAGVLECAGNGRAHYRPGIPGIQWAYGAAGNAHWAGVRLADVLRKAGLKDGAAEVLFDGADVPVGAMPEFRRSIPLTKALEEATLLAYEMNGAQLPESHGFPLRVIVPGWAGDSWVKWVTRIEVLDREYDGFFMKTAYRHPGRPVVPGSSVDPAMMRPITALRVKSVIASPLDGSRIGTGPVRILGAAWAGESPLTSVELSVDGGRSWRPAALGAERAPFAWRLWEWSWTPATAGYFTIIARARDASGDTQPFVQEWNPSGYLWNVIQQVGVEITRDLKPSEVVPPGEPKRGHWPPPSAAFKRACLVCHDAGVIEQQRLAPAQWERELDKMIRWGAQVSEQDRAGILQYLIDNFGPRR